jgi:hypothetical protein
MKCEAKGDGAEWIYYSHPRPLSKYSLMYSLINFLSSDYTVYYKEKETKGNIMDLWNYKDRRTKMEMIEK